MSALPPKADLWCQHVPGSVKALVKRPAVLYVGVTKRQGEAPSSFPGVSPDGTVKLTDKIVAALTLPAGKKDVIHFDDTLTGFGYRLRKGAGGKVLRSWVAQYRRAGASRRMLIGGGELTAEQARGKARKVLAKVSLGEDPQADKVARRTKDQVTMRAIVEQYLADRASNWRAPTLRDNRRYLTAAPYFGPLHSMAVDKIGRRDVASRIITIKRDHGPIVAGAARAKLSAFFTWGMQQGLCESNPVIGTEQPKRAEPRARVLSDAELAGIWRACAEDGDHGRIIRLLILLGSRRAEIGGMAWSELDLDALQPTWTLPSSRSKNDRPHTVPLLPMTLDIIRSVPQMATRDQLFGSRSAGGFVGWGKFKAKIDMRSGVSKWTVHDIRRTVATRMNDIGIAPHVVEQILNHVSGHRAGVAGVYNRSSYEREVRTALAQWHDHLRTLVEGGERKILGFPATATS
jgi:integrase